MNKFVQSEAGQVPVELLASLMMIGGMLVTGNALLNYHGDAGDFDRQDKKLTQSAQIHASFMQTAGIVDMRTAPLLGGQTEGERNHTLLTVLPAFSELELSIYYEQAKSGLLLRDDRYGRFVDQLGYAQYEMFRRGLTIPAGDKRRSDYGAGV